MNFSTFLLAFGTLHAFLFLGLEPELEGDCSVDMERRSGVVIIVKRKAEEIRARLHLSWMIWSRSACYGFESQVWL